MSFEIHKCILCLNPCFRIKKNIYDTRFGFNKIFDIYKCNKCGIVQTRIDASGCDIQDLYESFYNYSGKNEKFYKKFRDAFFSSAFYKFWILIDGDISFHRRRGNGRLLDVGCNYGRNLLIYKNQGFTVEGIEINKHSVKTAQENGLAVHKGCIEEFNQHQFYDTVVLSNVLEHAVNPKEMLLSANRLLKPGGTVWISTPNIESWQRFLFGRYWINWHVPFHFSFFSVSTITNLLQSTGYRTIQTTNYSPSLWMAQSLLASFFSKKGQPSNIQRSPLVLGPLLVLIRMVLFPLLYIGDHLKRGDCLAIEAKKIKNISK
jgi:2-polyprenyl-3-methyl-5-hydroxy-6-metoxy-1,4-benzoquinol methylase